VFLDDVYFRSLFRSWEVVFVVDSGNIAEFHLAGMTKMIAVEIKAKRMAFKCTICTKYVLCNLEGIETTACVFV